MKSLTKLLWIALVFSCVTLWGDDEATVDSGSKEDGTISISGIVFRDSNGNGEQDEGELVTEGAKVSLLDAESGLAIATAETDEKGLYAFDGVQPGKYPLEITFPSGDKIVTEPYEPTVGGGGAFLAVAVPQEKGGPKFADASMVNPANTPRFVVVSGGSTSSASLSKVSNGPKVTVQTIIPPEQVISPSAP